MDDSFGIGPFEALLFLVAIGTSGWFAYRQGRREGVLAVLGYFWLGLTLWILFPALLADVENFPNPMPAIRVAILGAPGLALLGLQGAINKRRKPPGGR